MSELALKTDLQNLKERISIVDTQQKLEQNIVDRIQKVEGEVAKLSLTPTKPARSDSIGPQR